ncbi:class I SAM-dependent methyltransferase [Mycetohabitans endofungorum]|uniref:class I SAM-dependent methyltransferase n=1 Tax=Mycetohabitans endofungorum TaxID=417203 RepID=UPI002B05F666|nr:class I SAM-dependent methyltransferase [Mycetohabitans endofungorum]
MEAQLLSTNHRTGDLSRQYDRFPDSYAQDAQDQNQDSSRLFHSLVPGDLTGLTVLDIGCGAGDDLHALGARGATLFGVEPSAQLCELARRRNPGATIVQASGESLPFDDQVFDVIVSKWALQTSPDLAAILAEIERTMVPGGSLVVLTKHPLRQYLEKIDTFGHGVDYFVQQVVASRIFDGQITLYEPTRTLQAYLSPNFLRVFDLRSFHEGSEFPAAQQLNGDTYPTYFALHALKR